MPTVAHPHIRSKGPRPVPAPVDDTTSNVDQPAGMSLYQAMERALLLSYKLVHHLSDLERAQQIMRQLITHRLPLPQQRKESAPLVAMMESIDGDVTVHWHDLLAELAVLVTWLREEAEAEGGIPS
jgi:hypothetical protein